MGNQLTVILGAGASHDLVPRGTATVNEHYKPPLTADLFAGGNRYRDEILQKYPDALNLAATIRIRTGQQDGDSLETVLKSLSESSDPNIARQFRQVPLYLQELFGTISEHYTELPVNYRYLVTHVLAAHFEKVAFVTLNYDLLLDKAIEAFTAESIDSLKAYVRPANKWMLVKLHGSVNWATRLTNGMGGHPRNDTGVLTAVQALRGASAIHGPLKYLSHHDERLGGPTGDDLLYPAIAIPVEGKYEYVCPDEHVTALEEFLSSCEDFLIIGTSGKDRDLLDLLNDNITRCSNFAIVGQADVESTYRQFRKYVPKLGASGVDYAPHGFTGFVRDQLDKFILRTQSR